MKKIKKFGKKLNKVEQKKVLGGGYGGACLFAAETCGFGTPPCCPGLFCGPHPNAGGNTPTCYYPGGTW